MCRFILCASSLVIVRFVHMFVFCYIRYSFSASYYYVLSRSPEIE